MILRIEEAIARAKGNGSRVRKKDIAAKLWPNSVESAQQVNMTKLLNGATQRILPEWIVTICQMCGCSADYLLGMEQ